MCTLVHGQQSTEHKWHLEHYTQYTCTLHTHGSVCRSHVLNGSAIGENSFLWWTVSMSMLHRVTLSLCSAEGSDFTSEPSFNLTFPDGGLPDDRVYVNISIEDDMILEAQEYFTVSLYTSDPVVKFYIPYARVRIIDNDSKDVVECYYFECG